MVTLRRSEPEQWDPQVDRWMARTQLPLDIFALATIWLSFIPITDMLKFNSHRLLWISARAGLSLVFAIDIGVRARLSGRMGRYLMTHPFGVLAALLPPFRLIFSLRLLQSMFRRGSLAKFLGVALLLVLNGAVLVVVFEHGAPGASITSIPVALWWTACTVSTVGYGDYTPITMAGRLVAVCIMGVGLTTVAVVTAQIASSFSDQAAVRRAAGIDGSDDATEHEIDEVPDVSVSENGSSLSSDEGPAEADDHQRHLALLARLQRIEAMLLSQERT
jgi:voltage-gated potassium channel